MSWPTCCTKSNNKFNVSAIKVTSEYLWPRIVAPYATTGLVFFCVASLDRNIDPRVPCLIKKSIAYFALCSTFVVINRG